MNWDEAFCGAHRSKHVYQPWLGFRCQLRQIAVYSRHAKSPWRAARAFADLGDLDRAQQHLGAGPKTFETAESRDHDEHAQALLQLNQRGPHQNEVSEREDFRAVECGLSKGQL